MSPLHLSNPFRRSPDAPTLKERAAGLSAGIARVARKAPPSSEAEPPPKPREPDPVDWHSPPPGFMASPAIEPTSFANIAEGIRIELERLRDIAQDEIDRVSAEVPAGAHETMRAGLENRLRRRFRLDEIMAALAPEVPVPAGIVADGLVYYEDAGGQTWRQSVAHWVSFTAQRLFSVARQERIRQFNLASNDLDPAGCEALHARLTRELRIDALQALAFRSDKVFEAEEARRQGVEPPTPTGPRHDLSGLGALVPDILNGWRAWSATLGKPEADAEASAAFERACERRDELLDAAEALPATPDSLVAKALALAWLGFAEEDRPGRRRSERSFVGRLAFDIHATATGQVEPAAPNADAALIALEAEFLAADAVFMTAARAVGDAWTAYTKPPMPKELRIWGNDWIHRAIPRPRIVEMNGARYTEPYGEAEVEQMRGVRCLRRSYGQTGEPQPDGTLAIPDPMAQQRVDAIVAAWDRWQAEIAEAKATVRMPELEVAREEARATRDAVLQRVGEATASGLAGLAIKARIAANLLCEHDMKASARSYEADDTEGLLLDLAGDVLALTGGLPAAHRTED